MRNKLYTLIQRVFSVFGMRLRRLESGVDYQSSFSEQIRLVGDNCLYNFEHNQHGQLAWADGIFIPDDSGTNDHVVIKN